MGWLEGIWLRCCLFLFGCRTFILEFFNVGQGIVYVGLGGLHVVRVLSTFGLVAVHSARVLFVFG